jgi:hypothetical protein
MSRGFRAVAVAATAAVVGAVGLGSVAPAAQAAVGIDAFVMRDLTPVGYYVDALAPHASAEAFVAPARTITATEDAGHVITTAVAGLDTNARVSLADGAPLAVGSYPIVSERDTSALRAHVVLHDNRALDASFTDGTLDVTELTRDTAGAVTAFAADIRAGYSPGLAGVDRAQVDLSLRWHSSKTYTGLQGTSTLSFGSTGLGSRTGTMPARLTVTGPNPVTFGAAHTDSWPAQASPASGPFRVVSDGCKGRTLTDGQGCTVIVDAQFLEEGDVLGTLVVPDDTPSGVTRFQLSGGGYLDPFERMHLITPKRFYDSRTSTKLKAGEYRKVRLGGINGIPVRQNGVLVAVTAANATAPGYLSLTNGRYTPDTSVVNYRPGANRSNLTLAVTDELGYAYVYNSANTTDVVIDVVGFNAVDAVVRSGVPEPGSQFEPVDPTRVFDSRWSGAGGPLRAGEVIDIPFDVAAEVNPGVTAAVVNLTAIAPSSGGYLSAFPAELSGANVSQLSFARGANTAALAIVPVSHDDSGLPVFSIRNGAAGATGLAVDVVGYLDDTDVYGLRLRPVTGRLFDTRSGVGTVKGLVGAQSVRAVSGLYSYGGADTVGLFANLTAIRPSATTYVTAWDGTTARPGTSNLNSAAGDTIANAAMTGLHPTDHRWRVYNAAGSTHLIGDLVGQWDAYPNLRDYSQSVPMSPASPGLPGRADRTVAPGAVTR